MVEGIGECMQRSRVERIKENYHRVVGEVESACADAGRSADEVLLVGVTKYVDVSAARALADAGCYNLGESRPQQLWAKAEDPTWKEKPAVRWHMIGHLQRNKVQKTLPLCDLIHAVDSERLLKAINDSASQAGTSQSVLLEVNCSGDEAKHGLTADQARDLTARIGQFPNTQVQGLMTMAARDGGPTVAQANFASLRNLRDELATPELPLTELSMGMSGDFREAIAEGSTVVRIGSALWEGID